MKMLRAFISAHRFPWIGPLGSAIAALCIATLFLAAVAEGQPPARAYERVPSAQPGLKPPEMGHQWFAHLFFDQLEDRTNGTEHAFRWDGEGWMGTDMNRLWIKTEGFASDGTVNNGDQEALYDRPIPHLRYFDMQAGVREDLDSGPRRTWAAVGIEGLAPYFFEFEPTFYFRNGGNVAGRVYSFYDLRITQRLVAQPEVEINFYNKDDPGRDVGSGLSDIDSGLRLRYEFSRKLAPYVGYAYNGKFGNTAIYTKQGGETVDDTRFVFGLHVWY